MSINLQWFVFTMQVIWLSVLGGDTATCQWQSSCASRGGQMARMQLDSFLPMLPSYNFLSFFSPPVLSAGGGRERYLDLDVLEEQIKFAF